MRSPRENAAAAELEVTFEHRDLRRRLRAAATTWSSRTRRTSPRGRLQSARAEVARLEPRLATVGEQHAEAVALRRADVLEPEGVSCSRLRRAAARKSRICCANWVRRRAAGLDLAGRDRVVEGRWPTVQDARSRRGRGDRDPPDRHGLRICATCLEERRRVYRLKGRPDGCLRRPLLRRRPALRVRAELRGRS